MSNDASPSRSATITSAPYSLPLPYSPSPQNSSNITSVPTAVPTLLNHGVKRKLEETFSTNVTTNGGTNTTGINVVGTNTTGINVVGTNASGINVVGTNTPSDKQKEQEAKKRVMQMAMGDKQKAINPDYTTPFLHSQDILHRLLCYHVFSTSSSKEDDWENEYSRKAIEIATKIEKIKNTI